MSFKDLNTPTFYIAAVNDKDNFQEQLPSNLIPGDMVITSPDNCIYVYTGSDWNLLSTSIADYNYIEEPVYRELLPQICKCCGAPLHNHKCEYCGVEYA